MRDVNKQGKIELCHMEGICSIELPEPGSLWIHIYITRKKIFGFDTKCCHHLSQQIRTFFLKTISEASLTPYTDSNYPS